MSTDASAAPAPKPGAGRVFLFRLLAVVLVLLAVEALAFAALWRIDGKPFSYAGVQADRRLRLASGADASGGEIVLNAQDFAREAIFPDGADHSPFVRLQGLSLTMRPRPPRSAGETAFRIPVSPGPYRITSNAQLVARSRSPVILAISLIGDDESRTALLAKTIEPGEIFILDESFDVGSDQLLELACVLPGQATTNQGVHLLLGDLRLRSRAGPETSDEPLDAAVRDDRPIPDDGAGQFRTDYILHPYLGQILRPGSTIKARTTGQVVFSATEYGFYDSQPPLHQRSPGKVIVAILGGSVAEKFSHEGTPVLERELRKSPLFAGKELVFVRAAVRGYKQPQQLMTVNYLLTLGGQFDVVVNIDGFNEVAFYPTENFKQGVAAIYPRNWFMHFRLDDEIDPEVRLAFSEVAVSRARQKEWARLFEDSPARYSITANLVWKWIDLRRERAILERQAWLQSYEPRRAWPYEVTGPRTLYEDREAMAEDLASIWKRSSLQLDRLSRGNGIRYFHFLQPNQYVPDSKKLTDWERRNAYNEGHPYKLGFDLGYHRLQDKGRELIAEGVRFRDLTDIYFATEETVYVDPCCHVNRRGNEIMAEAIARTLLDDFEARPDR